VGGPDTEQNVSERIEDGRCERPVGIAPRRQCRGRGSAFFSCVSSTLSAEACVSSALSAEACRLELPRTAPVRAEQVSHDRLPHGCVFCHVSDDLAVAAEARPDAFIQTDLSAWGERGACGMLRLDKGIMYRLKRV
jgi:hypothetical protein